MKLCLNIYFLISQFLEEEDFINLSIVVNCDKDRITQLSIRDVKNRNNRVKNYIHLTSYDIPYIIDHFIFYTTEKDIISFYEFFKPLKISQIQFEYLVSCNKRYLIKYLLELKPDLTDPEFLLYLCVSRDFIELFYIILNSGYQFNIKNFLDEIKDLIEENDIKKMLELISNHHSCIL